MPQLLNVTNELQRVGDDKFGGDIAQAQMMQSGVRAGGEMGRAEAIRTPERARDMAQAEAWNKYKRLEKHLVDSGVMTNMDIIHAYRGGNEIPLSDAQTERYNKIYGADFRGGGMYRFGIDSDGNATLAQATRGREDVSIDREQDQFRDTYQTGADYKDGVSQSGASGYISADSQTTYFRAISGDKTQAEAYGNKETGREQIRLDAKKAGEIVKAYYEERGMDVGKISIGAAVNAGWQLPGLVTEVIGAKGGGELSGRAGREWSNQSIANYVDSTLFNQANNAVEKARANGAVSDLMAGGAGQKSLVNNAQGFMDYGAGKWSVRRPWGLGEKAKDMLDSATAKEPESLFALNKDSAGIKT